MHELTLESWIMQTGQGQYLGSNETSSNQVSTAASPGKLLKPDHAGKPPASPASNETAKVSERCVHYCRDDAFFNDWCRKALHLNMECCCCLDLTMLPLPLYACLSVDVDLNTESPRAANAFSSSEHTSVTNHLSSGCETGSWMPTQVLHAMHSSGFSI
jgi:hypothetical protein